GSQDLRYEYPVVLIGLSLIAFYAGVSALATQEASPATPLDAPRLSRGQPEIVESGQLNSKGRAYVRLSTSRRLASSPTDARVAEWPS
ncbi:MAG: hypothetical protein WAU78_01670, partial [Roseiarcus sp.]